MKDLWWAIRGALAIAAVLFAAFFVYFYREAKRTGFRFPSPAIADFSAHLAGDYYISRTSVLEIVINPGRSGEGTPIIPSLVVECATDGRFIIAKRQGLKRSNPQDPNDTWMEKDTNVVDYWILDTQQPRAEGPLTEAEFTKLRRSLGIAEDLQLRKGSEVAPPLS